MSNLKSDVKHVLRILTTILYHHFHDPMLALSEVPWLGSELDTHHRVPLLSTEPKSRSSSLALGFPQGCHWHSKETLVAGDCSLLENNTSSGIAFETTCVRRCSFACNVDLPSCAHVPTNTPCLALSRRCQLCPSVSKTFIISHRTICCTWNHPSKKGSACGTGRTVHSPQRTVNSSRLSLARLVCKCCPVCGVSGKLATAHN